MSDPTADALTQIARAAVADALSSALRHATGNRRLDDTLQRRPLENSGKLNIVALYDDDPALRDIAIRESLKRPRSMLYCGTPAQSCDIRPCYVWELAESRCVTQHENRDASPPLSVSFAAPPRPEVCPWLGGRMRTRTVQEWAQSQKAMNRVQGTTDIRPDIVRLFLIAHGSTTAQADGFYRRALASLPAATLVTRLHDDILSHLGLADDDTLAINFICCNLVGVGERPGEPDSYVGQFCRALHSTSVGTRITLDVSASPYMLLYRDDSFTKYRLLDPFAPGQALNRPGVAALRLHNKMRWRWTPGLASIVPDWAWQCDTLTNATTASTVKLPIASASARCPYSGDALASIAPGPAAMASALPSVKRSVALFDRALCTAGLSHTARRHLNIYHFRVRRIDEQFLLSQHLPDSETPLDRLSRMARGRQPPSIEGIALFELFTSARETDAMLAAAMFALVAQSVSGAELFPEAAADDRNRYFSRDGRLGLHGARWVSGMFLLGRYRVRYLRTPDAVAGAVVTLAALAARTTRESRQGVDAAVAEVMASATCAAPPAASSRLLRRSNDVVQMQLSRHADRVA
ncbi:hypothetical protein [Robbsia sp. KACC 23696]|uniref:hypothetical protein n=1 Tax=Robbsia sp. KACC 23696 TaxID=3149231 RepID=UPI00325BEB75